MIRNEGTIDALALLAAVRRRASSRVSLDAWSAPIARTAVRMNPTLIGRVARGTGCSANRSAAGPPRS